MAARCKRTYCFLIVFPSVRRATSESSRYLCALARARPGAVITTGQMDQQKWGLFPLQGNTVAAICRLIIKIDL